MPVSITINPVDSCVDMYDAPDASCAYTLSGDILIKYEHSSSSTFRRSRSSHPLQLTSLELTFEGQSELILTEFGYVPLRIITLSKELVAPSQPILISADEDSWRLAFNLVIPGWLPATEVFGDDNHPQQTAGISYALHATARIIEAEESSSGSSSRLLGNIRSAVKTSPKPKTVVAHKVPITVSRLASFPTQEYDVDEEPSSPVFPTSSFSVQAMPEGQANIPEPVLRSLSITAMLPQKTSMKDAAVPLTIRVKSSAEEKVRRRMRIIGVETKVVQMERYTTAPTSSYVRAYPVPPPSHQPPTIPLRAPHPASTLRDMGLMTSSSSAPKQCIREHSLVPPNANPLFLAAATEEGVSLQDGAIRLDVDAPVVRSLRDKKRGREIKKVTAQGPCMEIRHEMRVKVTVGYDYTSSRSGRTTRLFDDLDFAVPVEFWTVAAPPSPSPRSSGEYLLTRSIRGHAGRSRRTYSSSSASSSGSSSPHSSGSHIPFRDPAIRSSSPSPRHGRAMVPLPAYNQLYYDNGDRKHEMYGALPVYRERAEESNERVLLRGSSRRHH